MKYFASKITVLSIFLLGCLASCDESTEGNDPGFDRANMLTELADNLIIPNFQSLQSRTDDLSSAINVFKENPSVENLSSVRESWQETAIDFQHCSAYGFGPGSLPLGAFAEVIGVFPVDETEVEANIQNPDFNLQASFARDIRGLYTIEYLIFRKDLSDQEVVDSFDAERIAYLRLIRDEFKSTIDTMVSAWTGAYRQEFIESDGTSAGSSVSQLYNEFVKDYENLKNFKVELPAGLTAGQESSDPTRVAAYYSGISTQLIEEHFQSSVNIWSGTTRDNESFTSFDDYLGSVVGGEELVANTEGKITEIEAAIDALPAGELSENVDAAAVATLRDELQANTANFKSSMSSLLGISITFNSGDGD